LTPRQWRGILSLTDLLTSSGDRTVSEQPAIYHVRTQRPLTPKVLKQRACCHPISDHRYRSPTAHEIESLIQYAEWSQSEFAERVGVSTSCRGSSTIRRWKSDPGSNEHRTMPYSAWRLALYESGLIPING